jgi:hypothetical protein
MGVQGGMAYDLGSDFEMVLAKTAQYNMLYATFDRSHARE